MKLSPRHIFAEPVIDTKVLARELALREYPEVMVAKGPLRHMPPNLVMVEYIENGKAMDLYQLVENYRYMKAGVMREEKKGRLVDGASVPQIAWWWCPPDGKHRRAAFIHDLDYALGLVPKAIADLDFYNNLIADGVSPRRAGIMYQAVKRFGDPRKSIARWSEPLYPVQE